MANIQDNSTPDWGSFTGYYSPNYTPVPDQLLDEHLAFLSGAETKVLLYIVRRTFGFKKASDNISLNQLLHGITTRDGHRLDWGTGLSRSTLVTALRGLVEKNLLITEARESVERGFEATNYRLRLASHPSPKIELGSSENRTSLVRKSNLQETVEQETERQETDPSNVRKVQTRKSKGDQRASHRDGGDHTAAEDPAGGGEGPEQPALMWDPSIPDSSTSLDAPESSKTGLSSVGAILHRRTENGASPGPPARQGRQQRDYPEERQRILAYIQDFAIEFGDEAPLSSSVSRAYNLWHRSGISIDVFTVLLYEARARTKEYAGNVKKTRNGKGGAFGPGKNRMPYFFGVLEQAIEQIQSKSPSEILAEHERQRRSHEEPAP